MNGLAAQRQSVMLVIGATVFCGLSLRPGATSSLAVLAGTLALGVAIHVSWRKVSDDHELRGCETALLVAILIFAGAAALGWPPRGLGRTSNALETLPSIVWAASALFVYLVGRNATPLTRIVLVATTVAFTALVGATHITATDGAGLDVLSLHIEASEALELGMNPYTDAVTVDDGAPTAAPEDVIEGYLYPPITAFLYSLGHWTFDDPRYTSLVAWLAFLTILGVSAARKGGRAPLLTLLLMASLPGWPIVLRAAWTEPVSLALAALAFVYWNRSIVSGGCLGAMLGSKQYFFVAAPLLALYRGEKWLRRALWAVLVVTVTIGAALVWDFSAFWSAAVEFHLSTPPRPDGQNLVGLLAVLEVDWHLPSLLPMAIGLAASITAGLWARMRAHWFLGLAFTLAASFVVSSQAFPNYWFLVAGLCGISLLGMTSDEGPTSPMRRDEHTLNAGDTSKRPGHDPYSSSR